MKLVYALSLSVLLISCSRYATNSEHIYLQARQGATIVTPSPLTGTNISHFYDLPNPGTNLSVTTVPPSL